MFAPTARITPTRLPWWWSLVAMWLLMAWWAPAFAHNDASLQWDESAAGATEPMEWSGDEPMRIGPWQVLNLSQIWRAARQRSGSGAPRLVPLAVMPTQTGAWWMGVSRSRTTGDTRFELRFTMSLDGQRVVLPHERAD